MYDLEDTIIPSIACYTRPAGFRRAHQEALGAAVAVLSYLTLVSFFHFRLSSSFFGVLHGNALFCSLQGFPPPVRENGFRTTTTATTTTTTRGAWIGSQVKFTLHFMGAF
ncbi:hypothetical protein BO71DRAFT_243563 [Aspergillus ellipticus CBS 707.79]|uniref:Uncharacterized protein n=1 Tax=Aspergillus ellipticus CBS 707.79 TaxID=1448320 RepID=A0A319ESK9_9EURO|nr:hypothetical protein BO71DRAFT_243563 [Aspergillus ellipticus CBS 707.79]